MNALARALVLADDINDRDWVQQALYGTVELQFSGAEEWDDLDRRFDSLRRAELLLLTVDEFNATDRMRLVERISEKLPDMLIITLAPTDQTDLALRMIRAGARDHIVLRRDDLQLKSSVQKLLRRANLVNANTAQNLVSLGKLFAIVGPQPHEGCAFLATHIGLELQRQLGMGSRVLLIDAATPAGAAAIFLNLTPTYSLQDAVADVYRCDQTLVDTAFTRHLNGMYVICQPEECIAISSIPPDDFIRLIQVLRGLFSAVVISIDATVGIETISKTFAVADRSVILTDQSILKSRRCKYILRALRNEEAPLERVGVVVDNYRRRLGLEPHNLAEILGLPLIGTLSSDGVSRIQAMNSGESMFQFAPSDPYCDSIVKVTTALLQRVTKPVEANKGFLSKWFG